MDGNADKKRFSRRDFLRLTELAVGSTVLAACAQPTATPVPAPTAAPKAATVATAAPAPKASPPPPKPATVWFAQRSGTSAAYMSLWDEMGKVFKEMQPNITVNYSPVAGTGTELLQKYLTMFVAGEAPDVYTGINEQPNVIMRKGQTLDLRPFIDRDMTATDLADFNPKQLDHFRDEKSWFAVPMYLGYRVLVWNKDVFKAEGVKDPPKSWKDAWTHEEYEKILAQLCKDQGNKRVRWGGTICSRWPCLNDHVVPFGGNLINPKDRLKCNLADPVVQKGLEWVRLRFWGDKTMPVPAMTEGLVESQAFLPGLTATLEGGSWMVDGLSKDAKFAWDLAPLPKGPVATSTTATTDCYLGWSKTKDKEATWQLLKFLSGPEWGKGLIRSGLAMPARKSLMDYYMTEARKKYPLLANVNLEVFKEASDANLGHTYPVMQYMAEALEIIEPMIDKVFNLGEAPVSALGDLVAKVDKVQQDMLAKEKG